MFLQCLLTLKCLLAVNTLQGHWQTESWQVQGTQSAGKLELDEWLQTHSSGECSMYIIACAFCIICVTACTDVWVDTETQIIQMQKLVSEYVKEYCYCASKKKYR